MTYALEQIQADMLRGNLTPGEVSDFRVYLAALYSLREGQHDLIRAKEPERWLIIRENCNSDAAATRKWFTTDLGKKDRQLTSEKRRIDKLIQALSTKWKALEGEARNQF